jgi:hypothetical protein
MRALLFWPYMRHVRGFETSTGFFGVLIGTTITDLEWKMAKETSSTHLLLLLFLSGVGQRSDLNRASVVEESRWRSEWERVRSMSESDADRELLVTAAQADQ